MLADDVNIAANGIVECVEVLGRNPVFGMDFRSDHMNVVFRKKLRGYLEPSHISDRSIGCIPSTRDLHGILLIANGIEYRLVR